MKKTVSLSDIKLRKFTPEVTRIFDCIKTMNHSDLFHELEAVLECAAVEHWLIGYEQGLETKEERRNA
jgi:hypothetical protein